MAECINQTIKLDNALLENVHINLRSVEESVRDIVSRGNVQSADNVKAWALKALTLTDLTTLSGDDSKSNVHRLCQRAAFPFPESALTGLSEQAKAAIHTAAVCVYPARVANANEMLKQMNKQNIVQLAAVATGFPSGQYDLKSRLLEIDYAIENGATEIDIVVDRNLVLTNNWAKLYDEISQMKALCHNRAHLKTILGIGDCGTMENVYKASMVAMMAGSDFIKTSTGKESVNATLPIGLVMIRAIQHYQRLTGINIGLKPAGGVKTVKDAIAWMTMIKETLGNEWLQPKLFRFGASGLLDDIEKVVLQI